LSGRFEQLSTVNEYENDTVVTYRQSEYSNRSNLMVGETQNNNQENGLVAGAIRPQSASVQKVTGAIKKIPENLKLKSDDKINNNSAEQISNYRASGPYIPLSDCFSGSPVLFVSLIKIFKKFTYLKDFHF
jgi:protein daughter of sevenless